MKSFALLSTALIICGSSQFSMSQEADRMAINELINKYAAAEDDGNMTSQAELMMPDRVYIGGAGRITDQDKNMQLQQVIIDVNKKAIPDVWWFTDARDRLIRFYGDGSVAVASFYWYRTAVLPTDLPADKANLFESPPPVVMTQVIVKVDGEWKISHTHRSVLDDPNNQP